MAPEVSAVSSRVPTSMRKPNHGQLVIIIKNLECRTWLATCPTSKILTHIDGGGEGGALGQNGETVVQSGHVVLSVFFVDVEGLVALEHHSGVVFGHAVGSGASVDHVEHSVDGVDPAAASDGEFSFLQAGQSMKKRGRTL